MVVGGSPHRSFGDDAAKAAQQVFERVGIGINDAVNGVYLAAKEGLANAGNATLHIGSHSKAYIDSIVKEIVKAEAGGRQAVINVLKKFADGLTSEKST
jgi:hypothetical protein